MKIAFIFFIFLLLYSCVKNKEDFDNSHHSTVFNKIAANSSNINFSNSLNETDSLNYFTYPYIYMGGGVAVGDINNDGYDDVFFTGNMVENKLYLNKGDFAFEDISINANITGDNRWYTGATMADVNGDGFLDIYVSVSGQSENLDFKKNELYINNGDLTFTESASKYGLDDSGQSVNATFFDYDNDGDLDMYLANYPRTPFQTSTIQYVGFMEYVTDKQSDHLYRNDGDKFTKVTKESGVMQYNLSLSAVAADFNNDGWQDLYVSSDFNSPDSFYLNMKDGSFKNIIDSAVEHTSFYGMGVDVADINNDSRLDIFQMDMDAASNQRSKANMASMDRQLFKDIKKVGFKTQYMQNSLQIQTGVSKNNLPQYSEMSRLAGVSSTDWSWAPLIADFDNDGFKDFFVSNGTRREINNKDYFRKINKEKRHVDSLLSKTLNMPTEPISNFVFKNNGNLTFSDKSKEWGITDLTFSNGAVYADFDNDGDLDLVTNNIDKPASVYENIINDSNYIQISLKGADKNLFALGSKVYVFTKDLVQFQELSLSRGFQSSVSPKLHFGIPKDATIIDSIKVVWDNKKYSLLKNVKLNQSIKLSKSNSLSLLKQDNLSIKTTFNSFPSQPVSYKHNENDFDDFEIEVLLPHKTSNFGPGLSVGDLNGDGKDDFFVGGASSYSSGFYYQTSEGKFERKFFDFLSQDKIHEDIGSLIFDADSDGDNDVYVVSGGNEFSYTSPLLQDRLFINDGSGNFTKSSNALPKMLTSGSRVYSLDFDKDGDLDLFVGGRLVPANYPYPANSYLLENISTTGNPRFKNVTEGKAPFLNKFGLVTSAEVVDVNSDGWQDIVVVGEWMPIKILINDKGEGFTDKSNSYGLDDDTRGWWFSVKSADFDDDGDQDFIVGNLGLNYKYKAKENETFDIYFKDFDGNKRNDIVLSYYSKGKKYPVRGRECSSQQIPDIKKRFKNYDSFSKATLEDVYGEELDNSLHYQVKSFASIYLENKNGSFEIHKLPNEAQVAPINQIVIDDFDKDGSQDLLLAGNLYASEVETPRADAGKGMFLKGDSEGGFIAVVDTKSGLNVSGDTKDIATISVGINEYIIAVKNNDFLQFVRVNK